MPLVAILGISTGYGLAPFQALPHQGPELISYVVQVVLAAAVVNGALGYGFSSLTVPIALLFVPQKVLSPTLVLVELAINSWVVVHNRASLGAVRRRAVPILIGLVPGILIGSYLLNTANPGLLKFWTYLVLLPLILLQAAGVRRPIRAEHAASLPLGVGVGVLYSTTTISGPPLAILFTNSIACRKLPNWKTLSIALPWRLHPVSFCSA